MVEFRMLSVRQPHADLLVPDGRVRDYVRARVPIVARLLPKTTENRLWDTPWRGTILVHSSGWPRYDRAAMAAYRFDPKDFLYGAVLGAVRLVDILDPVGFAVSAQPSRCVYCGVSSARCSRPVDAGRGECCPDCDHPWEHPAGRWAGFDLHNWQVDHNTRLDEPVTDVKGGLKLRYVPPPVLAAVLHRLHRQSAPDVVAGPA
jgi:hypothetical protein